MCLIGFSWLNHPDYKLVLVANRDEFYQRPSLPLSKWESGIYAGRDLLAGGTWLGMSESGRFAAVTNFRENVDPPKDYLTRGDLVKDFLEGNDDPKTYLESIIPHRESYQGFNLLLGTSEELFYYSNKSTEYVKVEAGIYGLSNAYLNTSWPKVDGVKKELEEILSSHQISEEDFFKMMRDDAIFDSELPQTGFGEEIEKALTPKFIRYLPKSYGTVNTTLVFWNHDGTVNLLERTFDPVNLQPADQKITFSTVGIPSVQP
jgi:uncharacterized protein with NRDE domain